MKKSTKIWLVIGAILTVAGLVMFTAVMTAYRWDFAKLSTVQYKTTTYEVTEAFTNVFVSTKTADIVIAPSPNGKCCVQWHTEEHTNYAVTVQDDTLTIQLIDEQTVKDYIQYIGIHFGSPKITVYLPEAQYASLAVKASTGSIRIADICADKLDLSVSTGQIAVSDATCTGDITIHVSTGKSHLTDVRCQNLLSQGDTGDITMENVIAADSFTIERTTGDVTFDRCDASEIFVKTDTGDVRGSLLSEKVFIAQTDTGSVTVPRVGSGGMCQINTDTGDIFITIAP